MTLLRLAFIFVSVSIFVEVKSGPVLVKDRLNLSSEQDGNTTLYFPMKFENKLPRHKYKNIAINASFIKGGQLTLILPMGDKSQCKTVLDFVDKKGLTDIHVTASTSFYKKTFPYNLHKDSKFILWLTVHDLSETIRIRVQKQGDVLRTVDECEYNDLDKIDHIILKGGLSHINSVISDFTTN